MESDNTASKKLNELFNFHKDSILQYCGHCKLSINFLSKAVVIKPANNEQKSISALFTWKFLQIKIRDRIYQKELDEIFLLPIFNQIAKVPKLKEIFVNWMIIIDIKKRRKCLKNIKDRSLLDDLFPESSNFDVSNNAKQSCRLKRKHSQIVDIASKKEEILDFEKVICESKSHCYECSSKSNKFFYCRQCPAWGPTRAILCSEKDGKEFLQLEDTEHSCSPILYVPEKYNEFKLLKKPNYEFVENCFIKSGKMLILFNPDNRNDCYEYILNKRRNVYCCGGCMVKGLPTVTAELCHEFTENEYIRLSQNDHVCQIRNYKPEKYQQSKKFILSPNFEVQIDNKKSEIKKTLIIFGENNRNFCYKYFYNKTCGMFQCLNCADKGKHVQAQLCQNDEGEEYVILSKAAHVCDLQLYTPDISLRPPEFKLMEENPNYPAKLFVFNSDKLEHGYAFF